MAACSWELTGRRRIALFVAGCVALILPLWIVRYPPLLDYPNHLASSYVLAHLHDPQVHFSQLYRADWAFSPYVATNATLVMLQRFLPVELAGRILLSICVLAFPLSVMFFARQVQAQRDLTVLWAFVLTYNIFFLVGFLQYCLSIAGCFAILGLWLRYLDRPSILRWFVLLAAVFALYTVHLFGFAMAGFVITVYVCVKRPSIRQIFLSLVVFVPGLFLILRSETGAKTAHHIIFGSLTRKLGWLIAWLEVHPKPVEPVNLAVFTLFVIFLLALVWKKTAPRWNRDWIKVAAVLFAMYWLLPGVYERGSEAFGDIDSRVLPFVFITILAAADIGGRRSWLAIVAIIIFVIRMVSLTQQFVVEQPRLARFARSFEVVPANIRVLPMTPTGVRIVSFLYEPTHFWGYGVIRRGWVSPYLFTIPGAQTLRLRDEPYPPLGAWTYEALDWERLRETYDYVWSYRLPYLSPALHTIGELVFADNDLEVFKMRSNSSPQK
jgi:hypothetical protein